MSIESKCDCQHCGGHIAFPAEMAGQMFECPHCKIETLLIPSTDKPAQQSAPVQKPNPPATKPSSSQIKLPPKKLTSSAVAVFFAFTTLCLASILVWEHLPNRSQQVSGGEISGSDIVTVKGAQVAKYRLDELTFQNYYTSIASYAAYKKSNGQYAGDITGEDAAKVRAYLRGN